MAVSRSSTNHLGSERNAAPDMTDQIMMRLGYAKLDANQARRHRFRRRAGRGLVALGMLATACGALMLHANSDRARRPDAVTLSQVLDSVAREREATRQAWVRTVDHARRLFLVPQESVFDAPVSNEEPILDPVRPVPDDRSPVPWSGLL